MIGERNGLTLDLWLRLDVYSVRKLQLFENLGLFQDSPALLGANQYDVKSRVRPQHFEAFLRMVKGGPLVVSKSTHRSFSLLAEEFGFDELSVACREFMLRGKRSMVRVTSRRVKTAPVKRPRVRFTSNNYSATYESLHSLTEIDAFVNDLEHGTDYRIRIDGIGGDDRLLENAVKTVYLNTVADFGDDHPRNPFLALTLWRFVRELYWHSIDTATYCLNELDRMAPTGFDKARLLLLSQCDSGSYGSFVPMPTANWNIIKEALGMLRHEKNGNTDEATRLLQQLSDTGRYDKIFGRWPARGTWTVTRPVKKSLNSQSGEGTVPVVKADPDKPSWFRGFFASLLRPRLAV
jgi:hypothetical protein